MSDGLTAPSAPPQQPSSAPPSHPDSAQQPPAPNPPASLKPLLNPLQTLDTPPGSTMVEPPRSPNPANEATDEQGRNVDNASRPAAVPDSTPVPTSEVAPIQAASAREPVNGTSNATVEDQPPLPIDAPVPPSPAPPHDEIPPTLAPGLIPPAVSTPTRITTEDDAMQGVQSVGASAGPAQTPEVNGNNDQAALSAPALEAVAPMLESLPPHQELVSPVPAPPAPTPAHAQIPIPSPAPVTKSPAPIAEPPAQPSAPVAQPLASETSTTGGQAAQAPVVAHQPSDAMEVDADGEADAVGEDDLSSSRAVDRSLEAGVNGHAGVKRAGEELAGNEEKRHQAEPTPSAPQSVPVQQSIQQQQPVNYAPAPVAQAFSAPQANGATTFVPTSYVPPPPRDAGPTTPLTTNQHKHILNAVRSLKKSKDAVNFLSPVDVVLFGIPHYVNIVTNPMDLGTVETKLIVSNPRGPPKDKSKMGNWDTSKGRYGSVSEAVHDVRQIWENTRMFNGPDHVVSQMATRLEGQFEKAVATLPIEPAFTPQASPAAFAAPAPPSAGPSTAPVRRASISRPPAPRRSSDGLDRPKREIHPPPSKELPYANDQRKKRRNDAQIAYLAKQIRMFETKNVELAGPFLYPVEELVAAIPDYSAIIKTPIDLNHIKAKINEGEYEGAPQLNADFRLMCQNAIKFNPPSHEVNIAAQKFLKLWEEKWKALPPKEVPVVRSYSEDPIADDAGDDQDDDIEEDQRVIMLREQIATAESKIEQIRAEHRKNRPPRPAKKSKPAAARKSSVSQVKMSPGPNGNGNGAPKRPRKSKDISYLEDGGYESEEEMTNITLTQKQELAEKITQADGATLQKAIELIAKSTGLDGSNEEIELDIDSLPSRTVVQLYNLVCRHRTPKKGSSRPKPAHMGGGSSGHIPGRKPGRKPGKKHMNEQEEADRIKKMEAQLQSFDNRGGGGQMGGQGGSYDDSDSSEDEDSEED